MLFIDCRALLGGILAFASLAVLIGDPSSHMRDFLVVTSMGTHRSLDLCVLSYLNLNI